MNELGRIVAAYRRAGRARAALATLVWTGGSTYRRRGARAIIVGDRITGLLSGGCIEADVAAQARSLRPGEATSIAYDFRKDQGSVLAFPLGCKGALRIQLEGIDARDPDNPVELLARHLAAREPGACAHLDAEERVQRVWLVGGRFVAQGFPPERERATLERACLSALRDRRLPRTRKASVEVLPAPIEVALFGAGADVGPLARFCRSMGWTVRVHRSAARTRADAAVVMTHNRLLDAEVLRALFADGKPPAYVGVLGPRTRTEEMRARLAAEGVVVSGLHAPAGLDLGGDGAEAVALSIVAEIQAVLHGAGALPLSGKAKAIHDHAP